MSRRHTHRLFLVALLAVTLLVAALAGGALAPSASAGFTSGQLWTWHVLDGGGFDDRFVDVARATDGSLYALGLTNEDYGVLPGQILLVKCDAAGGLAWTRSLIVPGATQVSPIAVTTDPLGNVIAVATFDNGTSRDLFVVKWNAAGVVQWTAVKASADTSLNDFASDVVADKSGNVYVCGAMGSGSSAVVVKYDADDDPVHPLTGLEEWTHYTTGNHAIASAEATSLAIDGYANLYVTGDRLMKAGGDSVYVQKLTAEGDSKWLRGWDGASHFWDGGVVVRYRNGAVYVGGESSTKTHSNDIVVLRYAARSGTRSWVRTWDNPVTHNSDEISDLRVDGHGNAYVTATTFLMKTVKYKALLLKLGPTGAVKWKRTYYDAASNGYGSWWSLAVSDSGTVWTVGFVVTATVPDWTVARYSAAGKRVWVTRWNGPPPGYLGGRGANACVLAGSLDLFVAGTTVATGASDDAALAWLRR